MIICLFFSWKFGTQWLHCLKEYDNQVSFLNKPIGGKWKFKKNQIHLIQYYELKLLWTILQNTWHNRGSSNYLLIRTNLIGTKWVDRKRNHSFEKIFLSIEFINFTGHICRTWKMSPTMFITKTSGITN